MSKSANPHYPNNTAPLSRRPDAKIKFIYRRDRGERRKEKINHIFLRFSQINTDSFATEKDREKHKRIIAELVKNYGENQ